MPHSDETFYKMKCGWSADPKVATLARFGPVDACLGRDLFGQMIDYARRELTDGLVPAEMIPVLAAPLPADDAMRVAMQLADDGPFGPLCSWDAPRNAGSNAVSSAPGTAVRILAYRKWNDTREEVQARKEQAAKAARRRWDGADAGSNAGRNAPRNAPARAHVDAEQEQEQEQENRRPHRNAGAGARPAEAQADDDDLGNMVVALLSKHGTITHDQALGWIGAVLASGGSKVENPRAFVVGAARRDSRKAYREATTAIMDTSSHQPARAAALCRRCSKTGHKTEDCPTLLGAAPAGGEGDETAHLGAKAAREAMANRERPAAGGQARPGRELHGEALARSQAAAARVARGADPAPPDEVVEGEIVDDDIEPLDELDSSGQPDEEPWF